MWFPVAGIEVHPLVPPLVAFGISFFTSMGGVSGAFLLLPFQLSVLGFSSPALSSTNQLYNLVAIPWGVWRYIREGRMVWPLTWIIAASTLPGVFAGVIIRIRYLPDPGRFGLFVGSILLYIGILIGKGLFGGGTVYKQSAEARFQELVTSHKQKEISSGEPLPRTHVESFGAARLSYVFYGERFTVSVVKIFLISAVIGLVGGVYGIGGGAIMAPILVAGFHLPVYSVAGAALMGTFITSLAAVIFSMMLAPVFPHLQVAPDWMLGLLFGVGGAAGMYCGAMAQKYFPARIIKGVLAFCLFFLAGKYLFSFISQ